MNLTKKILYVASVFLLLARSSHAVTLVDPIGGGDFVTIINAFLVEFVKLGALLLAVMVVYTGFLYVTAAGNEEKLKKAKTAFSWTLVGGAIILGAAGISAGIQSTITSII